MNKEEKSLFIFGDSQKVVERCYSEIIFNYPNIKVTGFHHGYIDINDQKIIEQIYEIAPDIVLVGLGAKKQEEWIAKWHLRLPSTKFIAVGGGLKVLSRERSRGPKWMQQIGLEWFIRLLNNPNEYWKRYIIGIPIFLFRIIVLKVKLTVK